MLFTILKRATYTFSAAYLKWREKYFLFNIIFNFSEKKNFIMLIDELQNKGFKKYHIDTAKLFLPESNIFVIKDQSLMR